VHKQSAEDWAKAAIVGRRLVLDGLGDSPPSVSAFCAEGDPFRPLAVVAPVGREESHGSMSKENLKDRRELLIP